jgi:hypothetical protein
VAGDIQPPGLARLVDFAERPRVQEWSLRSALVRYAQPEPERASAVLEIVRRIEFALGKAKFDKRGPDVWAAFVAGEDTPDVGLLQAAAEMDDLGDTLAGWAVDRSDDRPDDAVDAAVAALVERLEELGVPREEPIPRGMRGRG